MSDFSNLKLAPPILRALSDEGYLNPTPIQAKAIPELLRGHDLLGIAETGTGKTAAFALPLLHKLSQNGIKAKGKHPIVLILAPTRELAIQINKSLLTYGKHMQIRSGVVFGGAKMRPQIRLLAKGVHILVATPGRLLDLVNKRHVNLDSIETFILDEADRMLDMGFIPDIRKILEKMRKKHQTLMFSATMPKSIQSLADSLLNQPVQIEVSPSTTAAGLVEQSVLFVQKSKKLALLNELFKDKSMKRVLIFTRTKNGADRVTLHLQKAKIKADAIHGNKSQAIRQRVLNNFCNGHIRTLVATDIASRGLDVTGVTHVINFDLPNSAEDYVHRIGRTARAGSSGMALSFCSFEERKCLEGIEKGIVQTIPVVEEHAFQEIESESIPRSKKKGHQHNSRRRQKRRNTRGKQRRVTKAA